ncbi:unnamed protein product [Didymodactylos carnosus]|uniref:Uncharacterized protein n=1 Tax=Didymodactylos carnosus TaxID=1234261 RepID=A0A814BV06_9BILA|nr:unnamed protein product [Didymodactylos carnosus]CAF1369858.1 unnamed protein product [Didymodactylos carnosus]CAF3709415.1 unnamed protein product [Didymodactylos carnosus]CAF4179088.1 unnamed protein product [Didymodactylos carnosus]
MEGGDFNNNASNMKTTKQQPQMGLFQAINLLLACVIGSGIFISAKTVLDYSGSYGLSILVWIFCGLLCIMGALCYAELGCAYVSSGGDYTYLKIAFGDFAGFVRVWIEVVLSRPMIVVLSVLTAANYLIYWFYPTCPPPTSLVKCLASFLLLIVAFINLASAIWTNRLHLACNYFKIGSLLIVVGAGIYQICRGRTENFHEPFENSSYNKITKALYGGLFPYAGWNYLNNTIDNLKNPPKTLPRAIVISLLLCIVIYLLTFSSYFTALTPNEILMSDATAVSFSERVSPLFLYVIPIGVTMSCVGAASGNIFTIGQMFNVAGRDGLMPHIMAMKHFESNVPMIAILFEVIISFVFLFFMSNIDRLIICCGMINWIGILCASIALIVLRYTQPDVPRPMRVPLIVPILFIFILVVLIVASAVTDSENITTSLILLSTAIPGYVIGVMWKKKPKSFTKKYNSFATTLQKLFFVVPDEHVA